MIQTSNVIKIASDIDTQTENFILINKVIHSIKVASSTLPLINVSKAKNVMIFLFDTDSSACLLLQKLFKNLNKILFINILATMFQLQLTLKLTSLHAYNLA